MADGVGGMATSQVGKASRTPRRNVTESRVRAPIQALGPRSHVMLPTKTKKGRKRGVVSGEKLEIELVLCQF